MALSTEVWGEEEEVGATWMGTVPFAAAFIIRFIVKVFSGFGRFLLIICGLGEELLDCWSAAAGKFWRSDGLIGDRCVARILGFSFAVELS